MLITRLYIDYFGKFTGKEFILKPGINIIYGENRPANPAYLYKGMLFGIERLRAEARPQRMMSTPATFHGITRGAYGGQMDIRVRTGVPPKRSFHANDKYFTVTNLRQAGSLSSRKAI